MTLTSWLAMVTIFAGCTDEAETNGQAEAPCADTDADGICDEDDACPDADDAIDTDGDSVPDACDVCPTGSDAIDEDGDGVPDACETCPGADDAADDDADGVPDGCDVCPGSDDAVDSDTDGVPDGCDVCNGAADAIDTDADGVPDGCDPCPDDSPDDVNGDRVCDSDPAFDIAYVAEFTYENGQWTTNGTGVIVNTGLVPLDLDTLEVVAQSDTSDTADGSATIAGSGVLAPGAYAGLISAATRNLVVTDGFVTEPEGAGLFSMDIGLDSASDPLLGFRTVVRIDGIDIVLNHKVDFLVEFPSIVSFDGVARVSSERTL